MQSETSFPYIVTVRSVYCTRKIISHGSSQFNCNIYNRRDETSACRETLWENWNTMETIHDPWKYPEITRYRVSRRGKQMFVRDRSKKLIRAYWELRFRRTKVNEKKKRKKKEKSKNRKREREKEEKARQKRKELIKKRKKVSLSPAGSLKSGADARLNRATLYTHSCILHAFPSFAKSRRRLCRHSYICTRERLYVCAQRPSFSLTLSTHGRCSIYKAAFLCKRRV